MLKRLFDIFASIFGLILFSPLILVISVLIMIRMHGSALFIQKRAGKHGLPFSIYKFRTMTVDHHGGTVSIKGENRITPLGAILRKYKLDELPELWNILIGDMSFVGPRPDMPEYAIKLVGEEKKILELRPGLTGPATIKYSNEEEILESVPDPLAYNDEVLWPDKVRINLEYYYNRSFLGDLIILFRTISRLRN
jgi:lipopolysaccharide/colanic/teichoic acid biosynthesis glycosyltransferase